MKKGLWKRHSRKKVNPVGGISIQMDGERLFEKVPQSWDNRWRLHVEGAP